MTRRYPPRGNRVFSAKYTEAETGLLYYGYRYYQPRTGCWLSRDPSGKKHNETTLYCFAANDPVSLFDLLGLEWIIIRSKGSARASANPWIDDTIEDLARRIGLDSRESDKWLRFRDGRPVPLNHKVKCTDKFTIPNRILMVIGGSLNDLTYPLLLIRQNQLLNFSESLGYSVLDYDYQLRTYDKATIVSEKHDLHGIMFFGHGTVEFSDPVRGGKFVYDYGQSDAENIAASEMRSDYGYAIVVGKFCSAWVGGWGDLASQNGHANVAWGYVTTPFMGTIATRQALRQQSGR